MKYNAHSVVDQFERASMRSLGDLRVLGVLTIQFERIGRANSRTPKVTTTSIYASIKLRMNIHLEII